MKKQFIQLRKIFGLFIVPTMLTLGAQVAQAQVKVGTNPGTINAGSVLEIESTTKGVLLPRVALVNTTIWGLDGTPVAGMLIYNTAPGIIAGTGYPAAKGGTGNYYWDGTGWIATSSSSADLRLIGNFNHISQDAGVGANGTNAGTGNGNIAIGYTALGSITTASYNTAIGQGALNQDTEGANNTAIGYSSLTSNTTGVNNNAVGSGALSSNITGGSNVAIGQSALGLNQSGNASTAIGTNALYRNTASFNTAVGTAAAQENTTGTKNTALGYYALFNNSVGTDNTAVGSSALQSNTGSQNSAFGSNAMLNTSTGTLNSAFGYNTLANNTTGNANAGFGRLTLQSNISGGANAAFGNEALFSNTAGSFNTAIGASALYSNQASELTAVGVRALASNVTGTSNTTTGFRSLEYNVAGANNTSTGAYALRNTLGSNNTAIGSSAGSSISSGSGNIAIGSNVNVPSATADYQMNIGNMLNGANLGSGTGNLAIGLNYNVNNTAYVLDINGVTRSVGEVIAPAFTTTSDARLKRNVLPVQNALASVMKLNAVSYEKKQSLTSAQYSIKEIGFIAQDLRKVFPQLVREEKGTDKLLSVNYIALIPVLTKAIQEQQAEIEALKKVNTTLAAQLSEVADLKMALAEMRNEVKKLAVNKVTETNSNTGK